MRDYSEVNNEKLQNMSKNLLHKGYIGCLQIKNRIVLSPTETLYSSVNGEVTENIIAYYRERAKGGAGLIVLHSSQACTMIDPINPFAVSLRIDDNAFIPRLAQLSEAVQRYGARISALVSAGSGGKARGQLYKLGSEGLKDKTNVAPYESPAYINPIRALTTEEVKSIIKLFGFAARRLMAAGFDAMTIHAMGDTLLSQFLSPNLNKRDDEYGGNFDGRTRIIKEIVESCRGEVGDRFPILVRLSADEFCEDGREVEETVHIVKRLVEVGVDAFDISAGTHDSLRWMIPPIYMERGCQIYLAKTIKDAVKVPIIVQGRLDDPDLAEALIEEGKADFIGIARGFIADPSWANKVLSGQENDLRRCISCNYCITRIIDKQTLRCAINPIAGNELLFQKSEPVWQKKKVMVVGGGPAGLEAARVAAERGHEVFLYEREKQFGGQLNVASIPPGKDILKSLVHYYTNCFSKLPLLHLNLGKEADLDLVKQEKPDILIIACGAKPIVPLIPGVDCRHVVQAVKLLSGEEDLPKKGSVVVIGGGLVGVEVSIYLAQKNIEITIVELLSEIAAKEEPISRGILLEKLFSQGVKVMTNTRVKSITSGFVEIITENDEIVDLNADRVVLAAGFVSEDALSKSLSQEGINYITIGDAVNPRKIAQAIEEGFWVAREI